MAFGGKTITKIVEEMSEPSMTELNVTNNASVKIKSTEALKTIAAALKGHKGIKKVVLQECEIVDGGCEVLAEILKENHVIEELVLEKNKITAAGAIILADALVSNKGLRTLNLMQQAINNFGEEALERFITMFHDNVTLTKIQWRLESRKSFLLTKLQTRNVEIKKRQDKGEDFNAFLPDHLRTSAPPAEGAAGGYDAAPVAPAPAAEASATAPAALQKQRSSVGDMEEHIKKLEVDVGELKIDEEAAKDSGDEAPPAVEESAADKAEEA